MEVRLVKKHFGDVIVQATKGRLNGGKNEKENYYLHVIFDYGHRICFTYYGGGKIFA